MGAEGGSDGSGDEEGRTRALELLEAAHQFPCAFAITVIAFNSEPITEAVRKEARAIRSGGGPSGDGVEHEPSEVDYQARASREGKYLSHRFSVPVSHAGEALDLRARFWSVEGVVKIL